jgi:hypothetical protein
MTPEIREKLYARLRQAPSESTVLKSLPVPFFGDPTTARVATVAINPSVAEFWHTDRRERNYGNRRFETLTSLRVTDRDLLTAAHCDAALRRMTEYFLPGSPWNIDWFPPLMRCLKGMGVSYEAGEAVHLDVVQEATDPVWKYVGRSEQERLLAADGPFLLWLVGAFDFRVLLCNGALPFKTIQELLGVRVSAPTKTGELKWSVGTVELNGRRLAVAGWDLPLAWERRTGLGPGGEAKLGRVLAAAVGEVLK